MNVKAINMKKHLVSLRFDVNGTHYLFSGLVTGKMFNGKFTVSPSKIFKQVFGFELPAHSTIHY